MAVMAKTIFANTPNKNKSNCTQVTQFSFLLRENNVRNDSFDKACKIFTGFWCPMIKNIQEPKMWYVVVFYTLFSIYETMNILNILW